MFLMDNKHKSKVNIMLIEMKEIKKKNQGLEIMFKMLKVELL